MMPPFVRDLFTRILNKKKKTKFPHSLRHFAATLNFHSPAAYLFVRKQFLHNLPHPKTLRMWMQNIDNSSGISGQALKIISNVVQHAREKENKKIVLNLTIDEMSIRKRIDWDGQKSHGFVDVGTRSVNGDVQLASEVLVFMLVAINDKFKLPVAYYFTDKLNGREKAKLLKSVLCETYEKNIDIVSITFDGASSNISMCEELGAHLKPNDIENIVPYFAHPANDSKRIRIFYDACHMLKLVRNTIGTYVLKDNDDQTISWDFIKQLVFLQDAEKLHLATKVRNQHVYFRNEKMKVKLAAQVLSTSVSDALKFLEHDLKLPEFATASTTATFCKMFNDMFDLLNSRNLYSKTEMKKAITKEKIPILKDKIKEFISYIKSLKMHNIPVLQSNRKIGFIGFIINLQNSIALAEDLFNENTIEFLLTYKLSQDHVETFFSKIRRMNGWNNNPSAKQFQSSFRKILYLSNMSVPLSANCTPQDDTVLLNMKLSDVSVRDEQDINENSEQHKRDVGNVSIDHDYFIQNNWCFTKYAAEVITYIAGFVARTVTKKINCLYCKQLLISSDAQKKFDKCTDKLLQRKNRNGLYQASRDVIVVCKTAEKTLRSHSDKLFKIKNILHVLICQSSRCLPSYTFNTDNHVFRQSFIDHRSKLIRLILRIFLNLRLKHETTTSINFTQRIRMRNNKLTLFQNQ